jgi:hypothetical protein
MCGDLGSNDVAHPIEPDATSAAHAIVSKACVRLSTIVERAARCMAALCTGLSRAYQRNTRGAFAKYEPTKKF